MKENSRSRSVEPASGIRSLLTLIVFLQVVFWLVPLESMKPPVKSVDFTFTGSDTVLQAVPFPVNLRINNNSMRKCAIVVVAVPKVLQMFGAVITPNSYSENTIIVEPGSDVQLLYYMQQLARGALELQVIVLELKESGDQYQSPEHLTLNYDPGTVVHYGTENEKAERSFADYNQS